VARALAEPAYLSTSGEELKFGDACEYEVEGATFVGQRIVCVTSEEKSLLGIYDLAAQRHECIIELAEPPGTRLMALDEDHIVLFDGHPRVLQSTGSIIKRWNDLDGGDGVH
jgi:hypothetical protein